jgi:hypothetical protein
VSNAINIYHKLQKASDGGHGTLPKLKENLKMKVWSKVGIISAFKKIN